MTKHGKTIRLFLADGSPLGIISAEIINWTGKVLSFPRLLLPEALKRPEVAKTGVYFLIGPDPNNPPQRKVYVGKSDDVARRLREHDKDDSKDWFDHVALFVSKDENLTTGHAGFLENQLISTIRSVGTAKLENGNDGSPVTLPESEVSDMHYVLQQLQVLMPALGFTFMQELPRFVVQKASKGSEPGSTSFELSYLGGTIRARAYESEGRLVVLSGSRARRLEQLTPSVSKGSRRLLEDLLIQGKLAATDDSTELLTFTTDVGFSSPSAAAEVICGASVNGKDQWKVEGTLETYGEWREKKLSDDR